MNSMFGLQGIPMKVSKLGDMGTVNEVIDTLKDKSKNMENPHVMRVDDGIVIFDFKDPKKQIEEFMTPDFMITKDLKKYYINTKDKNADK